ncbi:MAG: hypothetical protein AUG49_05685 [Catenulispora sp. 13_1_20CM_3_70_7]|nr:MAG: hypothetical protein AUG49_05685 [Catenulispora sp. 13_1_20CM_3_70_7]
MRVRAVRRWLAGASGLVLATSVLTLSSSPANAAGSTPMHLNCATGLAVCTEVHDSETVFGEDVYVGHDEPATLFYDSHPGAGNNNTYLLRLPKDPPRPPNQNGTGGTFNFQLHPAFWFGMAMCDTESAPEFTHVCKPDTDANIFDGTTASDPRYIGHHPGTAFMEMQFYPPGWVSWPPGLSCDARQWCAALNIDSLSEDQNNPVSQNADCLNKVGIEPVNFAFITHNGKAHAPADPLLATTATFTPNRATDLFMNSGDQLAVVMHDTPAGFRVDIRDLSSHQSGSMTASIANQFGQVIFDPAASTCSSRPYAFHPMYSTSSEHTRVPWAAHSYNTAFSDEIGHFEYCAAVDGKGNCTQAAGQDATLDSDDVGCFPASASLRIKIGGCLGIDSDFDGSAYQKVWPGSTTGPLDRVLHPEPIIFSTPLFNGVRQFERVGFEADLPRIEAADVIDPRFPPCNRLTGANCVNPPPGAQFYPFYSNRNTPFGCQWQEGGDHIPGTIRDFGGNSTAEFGPLLTLTYPFPGGPQTRINDFRRVLDRNPCRLG